MIELAGIQKLDDRGITLQIDSLKVRRGEIVALVGGVDSGRDTLFRLLLGQTRPTMGTVKVAGVDPHSQKALFSRKVGVLFPDDNLYDRKSSRANLSFYAKLHGLPMERVNEVLTQVGLSDHAEFRAEKLSPSLARRLAFGRAILHQPEVLLLVEPFNRCDSVSIIMISRMVRQSADEGTTVLILSDDTSHLASLCDVLYRLEQGRIVERFNPNEERQAEMPFKIPVRLEGKVVLVNPADILYAVAEEDKTYLQTIESRLPIQFTLSELEERLARSGFFRAHRGYLVNLQHVKEVIQFTRNSYNLRLDDPAQTEIPLSKTAAGELSALLGY